MPALENLDSYWVIEKKLLAGAYPGSFSDSVARQRLDELILAGIRCVIDLTSTYDTYYPYADLLKEEAGVYDVKVEAFHFEVEDLGTPTHKMMIYILDLIDRRIAEKKPVYVHCMGGIGRTGTVIGCYLVRHGMSGPDALAHIEELRQDTNSRIYRSPETDHQIQYILHWQANQ